MRVLDQIDEHLLHLRRIDVALELRRSFDAEGIKQLSALNDLVPARLLLPRLRQARELGVRAEERAEKGEALLDQAVDLFDAVAMLRLLLRAPRRMKERADRRDAVVDLVVHDPDRLLPDGDLLPPELRREPLEQDEAMPLRIQMKDTLADVEDLVAAVEDRVLRRQQRL